MRSESMCRCEGALERIPSAGMGVGRASTSTAVGRALPARYGERTATSGARRNEWRPVEYEILSWHAPKDSKLARELSSAMTHARTGSLKHAPNGISARPFPRPPRSGSTILDLSEAQHEQGPGVTQAANRRNRGPGEPLPEEQELRRPPSPFLLLDADHTRPELPTDACIVYAISVP